VIEFNNLNRSLEVASDQLIRRNEDLATLLLELNHRVKNTLAALQSIVDGTMRSQGAKENLRAAVRGRIAALSTAQDLLTHTGWREVELENVVSLAAGTVKCEVEIEVGPRILLTPKAVVAVSQSTHEACDLLCKAETPVSVSWALELDQITISFLSAGDHDHTHDAFGLRVLDLCIARQMNGRVETDFGPAGGRIQLHFPLMSDLGPNANLEHHHKG
jgi:hypothetical protein